MKVDEILERWQQEVVQWWENNLDQPMLGGEQTTQIKSPYRSFVRSCSKGGINRIILTGKELLKEKPVRPLWKYRIENVSELFCFFGIFEEFCPYLQDRSSDPAIDATFGCFEDACHEDLVEAIETLLREKRFSNTQNDRSSFEIICDLGVFNLGTYRFINWVDYFNDVPEELKRTEKPLAEYTHKPIEIIVKNTYVNGEPIY